MTIAQQIETHRASEVAEHWAVIRRCVDVPELTAADVAELSDALHGLGIAPKPGSRTTWPKFVAGWLDLVRNRIKQHATMTAALENEPALRATEREASVRFAKAKAVFEAAVHGQEAACKTLMTIESTLRRMHSHRCDLRNIEGEFPGLFGNAS